MTTPSSASRSRAWQPGGRTIGSPSAITALANLAKSIGRSGASTAALGDVVAVVQPDADDLAGEGDRGDRPAPFGDPRPGTRSSGAIDGAAKAAPGTLGELGLVLDAEPGLQTADPLELAVRVEAAVDEDAPAVPATLGAVGVQAHRVSDRVRTGWATAPGCWPARRSARPTGTPSPGSTRRQVRPDALRFRVLQLALGPEVLEDLGRVELLLKKDPSPEDRGDRRRHLVEAGDDRADRALRELADRALREASGRGVWRACWVASSQAPFEQL